MLSQLKCVLILLLVIVTTLITPGMSPNLSQAAYQAESNNIPFECRRLYLFNGLIISSTSVNTTLILETPRNISLVEGLEQRVIHVLWINLDYDDRSGFFHLSIEPSRSYTGFFISMVDVCYPEEKAVLSLIRRAMLDPKFGTQGEIPDWIRRAFIKTPKDIVIERVIPAYESWFNARYNSNVSEASVLGIAVTSSFFVTNVYINYSADPIPKSIEEVIEARRGDCDDMSRVVVEVLNYYGIPAVIASGYVYAPTLGTLPVKVGNTTYIFSSNGPHAFPMAYIPGVGWISLDFIAGSLIVYPIVLDGFTTMTDVSPREVEEFVKLHESIVATQVIKIMDEEEYKTLINKGEPLDRALYSMMLEYAGLSQLEPSRSVQNGDVENETTETIQPPSQIDTEAHVHGDDSLKTQYSPVEVMIGLSISIAVSTLITAYFMSRSIKRY